MSDTKKVTLLKILLFISRFSSSPTLSKIWFSDESSCLLLDFLPLPLFLRLSLFFKFWCFDYLTNCCKCKVRKWWYLERDDDVRRESFISTPTLYCEFYHNSVQGIRDKVQGNPENFKINQIILKVFCTDIVTN